MRRLALLMVLLLIFATDAGCGRAPTLRENGGYVLTFHADSPDSGKEEAVATSLSRRLRLSRLPHATVKVGSKGVFVVELPGASETDLKWAMHLIGGGGHLEFRILARPGPDDEVIARAVAEHSGSDSSDFRWLPLNTEKIT